MKKTIFCLLLAATSAYNHSYAQSASVVANSAINEKDAKFLSDIMAMNSYELMLMKMTSQKAQSGELRNVVEPMINDHQRLDAQLTAYANRFNLAMDPEKREKYIGKTKKWDSDAAGTGWDKDMIEELVDVHKDGVDMLQDAAAGVKSEELKGILNAALPQMKGHLDMLLPLKGDVKGGRTTDAASPAVSHTNVAASMPAGNEKDAKFLSDLRLMNTYELQLMELILKKGNHRALKDVAQHMLEDHQKLNMRVTAYARSKMYGNDPDEQSKTIEKVNKWRQKKGGMEWDADIIEELIDVHKDGIDMLEDAISDVKDDELKTVMNDALPAMKMHLEMLEPLKETIKKPWKGK